MHEIANTASMSNHELNNPDVRHHLQLEHLPGREQLVAAALADEPNVSPDTMRQDLMVLENRGVAKRVRGGAVPVSTATKPLAVRRHVTEPGTAQLAAVAASRTDRDATVFLDRVTVLHAVASRPDTGFRGLVMTPAPAIALAVQARGLRVYLIGGTLSAYGRIATGGAAERAIALASTTVIVVTASAKLTRRARHRVLDIDEIDQVVTDHDTAADTLSALREACVVVHLE